MRITSLGSVPVPVKSRAAYQLDASGASHVVVKVLPGGDRYRIYLLEAADESMRVKAVLERQA